MKGKYFKVSSISGNGFRINGCSEDNEHINLFLLDLSKRLDTTGVDLDQSRGEIILDFDQIRKLYDTITNIE